MALEASLIFQWVYCAYICITDIGSPTNVIIDKYINNCLKTILNTANDTSVTHERSSYRTQGTREYVNSPILTFAEHMSYDDRPSPKISPRKTELPLHPHLNEVMPMLGMVVAMATAVVL